MFPTWKPTNSPTTMVFSTSTEVASESKGWVCGTVGCWDLATVACEFWGSTMGGMVGDIRERGRLASSLTLNGSTH